jgi:hypothetical protein
MANPGEIVSGELRELMESREEVVSRRGMYAYRRFMCLWSERYLLAPALGSAYPDGTHLRLTETRCKPAGRTKSGVPGDEYDLAIIECQYATLTGPDDAPASTWEGTCEILEVGGGRTWTTGGAAIEQQINKKFSKCIEIVEYSVATESLGTELVSLQGCVNDDVFRGQAAGRVLYDTFTSRQEWNPDLLIYCSRVFLRFVINPDRSHNEVWRADTGAFDTTSPLLYTEADLSPLIPT